MEKTTCLLLVAVALALGLAVPENTLAQQTPEYRVTITNLTAGQIFSPPIVVSHSADMSLFEPGQPALPELAALAEDGGAAGLATLLSGDAAVMAVAIAAGPVPPGQSVSVTLEAGFPFDQISVAGMLVTTNDAFFGLSGALLPFRRQPAVHLANAYDAGSEANNESCGFIPGPPCGSPGVRDTDGAEGYVYIHPGIHGTGDLDPALHDWRNPVARIVIRRTY